jgi:hypothetical protein
MTKILKNSCPEFSRKSRKNIGRKKGMNLKKK